MAEFLTARFPDQEMPKTQDRKGMFARVRAFITGQARLREAGGTWSRWREQGDILDRIDRRTSRMGVGPKLIVQRASDRRQLSIRELATAPKIPDLGAAPEIEKIHAAVWNEFDVRSGGLWLCRYIDGTHSVSKHGYLSDNWKGAAEDIFVLAGGMPALVQVAEFIVNGTKAGKLEAAAVIVDRKIWTAAQGWHAYSGNQHFHCHVEVAGGHACTP